MRRIHLTLSKILVLAGLVSLSSLAHAATPLGSYNVDPNGVTVAGISSGGFMAVQMDVAWSSHFHGVAVFAGGPYYCAQDNQSNATGYCLSGSSIPLQSLITYTDNEAKTGAIDPTSHLAGQPVYLFSGTKDTTVHQAVMNSLQQYFAHYMGDITYDNMTPAAHGWISPDGPNACGTATIPYINNCQIDPEQTFLTQFYGHLNAKNTGTLSGSFIQFEQDPFCNGGHCAGSSMDSTGWVYVPASCQSGQTCRVVLALHGCLQYQGIIGEDFVKKSGLNEWADTNNIIVLYPQTVASSSAGNPEGCWDWWGYSGSDYALQSGPQMAALMAMVQQLQGGLPDGGMPVTGVDAGTEPDAGGSGACTTLGLACTAATACCAGSSCQYGFCLPSGVMASDAGSGPVTSDGGNACVSLGSACSGSSVCCAGTTCQYGYCLETANVGADAGSSCVGLGLACLDSAACCPGASCQLGFCLAGSGVSDAGASDAGHVSSTDAGRGGLSDAGAVVDTTDGGISTSGGNARSTAGCSGAGVGGAVLGLLMLPLRRRQRS